MSGTPPGGNATVTPAQQKAAAARAAENAAKQRAIAIAKELGKIIADELGITDALDCFTTGSLGACGATAATVISSLIGGGPAAKLASKYWYRLDKGLALGKRIVGLGKKLWQGFKDWRKSRKEASLLAKLAKKGCKSNSFTPTTRVLMADGTTKKIADVEIGDKVLATDPETGRTKTETVTAEITGTGLKHLVKVTVDTDGKKGTKTASVTATDGHPFWVPELSAWLPATVLKSGDWLRTSAGTRVQITTVERWTLLTATVHNLTVSELHTYYVLAGVTPVLVHNCNESMDFVHGTSSTHADNIEANGLSGDAARANSSGGSVGQPGNLFTYRVSPGDSDTLGAAATFGGSRTASGDRPAILIFRMCKCTYDRLMAEGHITTRVTDEVSGRVEHIFGPGALPHLQQVYRRNL
jgi:Pretoxin HINT domain